MTGTRIHIRVHEDDDHGLNPGDWEFGENVTARDVLAYLKQGGATIEEAVQENELLQSPRIVVEVVRPGQKPDTAEWKAADR